MLLENYSYYYYSRQYVTLLIRRITLISVLGDIKSLIYIKKNGSNSETEMGIIIAGSFHTVTSCETALIFTNLLIEEF